MWRKIEKPEALSHERGLGAQKTGEVCKLQSKREK